MNKEQRKRERERVLNEEAEVWAITGVCYYLLAVLNGEKLESRPKRLLKINN